MQREANRPNLLLPDDECVWCSQSRKRCRQCGCTVCPRHVSAANGSCLPCLQAVQNAVDEARTIHGDEIDAIEAVGGPEAHTYGELTPLGVRALATRLKLGPDDFFVDLGSGAGRAVLQIAKEFHVATSCGVEMAATRHEMAMEALESAEPQLADRVRFIQGDCADSALWSSADAPLAKVTVIFAANIFFGPQLSRRLARLIEAAPNLRAVATLKRWPAATDEAEAAGLVGFDEQLPPEPCETSWKAPDELGQVGASAEDSCSPLYVFCRKGGER